ncbi:MAG: AAA family ATPase [Sulfuricurvum sp.]|nr:AAA family ATPase [Sulfuricurvum sp.]MDD5386491.1 AAA family ATPase [Sulfuricurvum sp.]
MKIQDVTIQNFRGISAKPFTVSLDPQLTVFIGSNGIGKSTVLDALSIVLSRVINQIKFRKNTGIAFKDTDIPSGRFDETLIAISPVDGNLWSVRKDKATSKNFISYDKEYIDTITTSIFETENLCSIPLFVYYRTNRSVLDIPLKIRKKHDFSLLEAYDEALVGGANFRHFFEWFRNREDSENENYRFLNQVGIERPNIEFKDKQLTAVRTAIENIMGDFSDLSVKRKPSLRMVIKKRGKELRVDHLSDGEKCMLAMIGDLARRLAIANPTMNEPLKGEGIVLIDEIELHLHPAWQRMILGKLCEVFQNCQFIISTHSPQTVGEVSQKHIRILEKNVEDQLIAYTPNQSLGLTSGEILEELMNTPKRDEGISKKLDAIHMLIDNEEFESAQNKISELETELNGSRPDLTKAEAIITMLKPMDL